MNVEGIPGRDAPLSERDAQLSSKHERASEVTRWCDAKRPVEYAKRTKTDRFYGRIGMPMIDQGFSRTMKVTLYVAVAAMTVMWICLYVGAIHPGNGLSPQWGRFVNGGILFVGAGLRLLAHNQPHARWKFADFLGKMLAYYGAFTLLLLLAFT